MSRSEASLLCFRASATNCSDTLFTGLSGERTLNLQQGDSITYTLAALEVGIYIYNVYNGKKLAYEGALHK